MAACDHLEAVASVEKRSESRYVAPCTPSAAATRTSQALSEFRAAAEADRRVFERVARMRKFMSYFAAPLDLPIA